MLLFFCYIKDFYIAEEAPFANYFSQAGYSDDICLVVEYIIQAGKDDVKKQVSC